MLINLGLCGALKSDKAYSGLYCILLHLLLRFIPPEFLSKFSVTQTIIRGVSKHLPDSLLRSDTLS